MSSSSVNSTTASALSLLGGTTRTASDNTTRVASSREVQSASDNAAYWSIATTMKSSSLSLSSAEDGQALSAAIADTAAVGMSHATEIVSEIQSKLILAKTPGVDRDALNSEITQLKEQLGTVIDSSSFNGQNWLKTSASESPKMESMVGSVTSNARGDVSVNVINFDRDKSNLVAEGDASDGLLTRSYSGINRTGAAYDYYLLDAGSRTPAGGSAREIGLLSTTTDDEIDGMISAVNSMMKGMADGGAAIGATGSRIDTNADFLASLQDVTEIGVGTLVDANLEEEAARRAAVVVQQQLQTFGLNITNASMAGGLKIFA